MKIERFDSLDGNLLQTVEYVYDPLDRRIAKRIDSDGDGTVDQTSYVIHDGLRSERDNAGDHRALELNESGEVTRRYLFGPAVDQVLAEESLDPSSGEGDTMWLLADRQGSIRDVVDFDEALGISQIANHIVYDAFGNVVSETDAAVDATFGFTGRERDEESDLFYYRARYYDPGLGRFLSEDPIGFEAGDANLTRYVGNDPVGKVDPSGLRTLEDIRALQEKDARIKRMVKENLAQGVLSRRRGWFRRRQPKYDYVVVTDVLGDSVVSIVFRARRQQLGYGGSIWTNRGIHWDNHAWVTTYKPVYEITRKISKLQRKNVGDVVRSLRTPHAVRNMVAMAKGKQRRGQLQALVVSAEILHGLTPLATGIEEWRAGKRGSALLSFAGDAATILSLGSLGAAKYAQVARGVTKAGKWSGTIRVTTASLGLAEGAGRGVQGVVLLYETDGRKGYGYIGEAFLRLMGVAADVKASRIARQGTSHAEEVADAASLTRRANSGDDAVDAAAAAGRVDVPGSVTPREAVLGRKLDYLFGKATGSAHNIERSTDMLRQLERIGLHDTPANRQLMAKHFQDVLNDASNIAGTGRGGTTIRESLLMGPNGAVKIVSYWDGNVLRTFKLLGGKGRFKHRP